MPKLVVGVDEAGRGALAGPVYAAAVMLGPAPVKIAGLNDSKKLSASRRAQLAALIIEECVAYCVAMASVEEIEEVNIAEATYTAMQRAVAGIVIVPDEVLVDGNVVPQFPYPSQSIVGGDALVQEIMAASILAKQARDEHMRGLDTNFPGYDFARHKGYGTKAHLMALEKLGPCAQHRKTFAPVARLLGEMKAK